MDTTAGLSPLPARRLKIFIADVGSFPWHDPDRAEGLIKNMCGSLEHESELLMLAVKEGVPAALRRAFDRNPGKRPQKCVDLVTEHFAQRIERDRDEAAWAVETIAASAGLIPMPVQKSRALFDTSRVPIQSAAAPEGYSYQAQQPSPEPPDLTQRTVPSYGFTPYEQAAPASPQANPPAPTPPAAAPSTGAYQAPSTEPLVQSYWPESIIPEEVEQGKWCWSGFLGGIWWMWAHGMRLGLPIYLVLFVVANVLGIPWIRPLFFIGLSIFLGLMGNQLAWQNRTFNSKEEFRKVQRAWLVFGICWSLLQLLVVGWLMYAWLTVVRPNI